MLAFRMRYAHLLAALCLCTFAATAQIYGQSSSNSISQGSGGKLEALEFEVATIKPVAVQRSGNLLVSLDISPGGRIRITSWSLKALISAAYNLRYWQLKGGEEWTEKELYDIEAKPPVPSDGIPEYSTRHDYWTLDDPRLRAMLQDLLKDRFGLKVHTIEAPGPIYLLERSDKALALSPSKQPGGSGGFGGVGAVAGIGYRLTNTSMAQLAAFLSWVVFHQPVIDKTGLDGSYDFESKTILTNEDIRANDPASILPAVKEMGLKLTRSTGPVTTMVIDSAARPSAN